MSYMPNYTYNPMNEKLVPKSAVVIDLPSLGFGDGERVAYCLRNHSSADCNLFDKLAAQIEAQIKPPRIPEPSRWGVVKDANGDYYVREAERGPYRWVNIDTRPSGNTRWEDIVDPVLINAGKS